MAQSTIGRIPRGEVDPQSGTLDRLARALDMPLTALVRIADDVETHVGPAILSEPVGGDATWLTGEIDRTLLKALACREDRKRGEQALKSLHHKEMTPSNACKSWCGRSKQTHHTEATESI